MELAIRPRRNRKSQSVRDLVCETKLHPSNFVYPVFIHDKNFDEEINSMPGQKRWSIDGLLKEIKSIQNLGINAVILFPAIEDDLKTPGAEESYNPKGLVQRTVQATKKQFPDLCVMTDVALDPYNSNGHDGIVNKNGNILNDESIEVLCKQALSQAKAGSDVIAPSDMMDGRVREIRKVLDKNKFTNTSILSYTAKYASAFYGPFRGALDSAPKSGDKKTYQINPANALEACREAKLDADEGADMLMVKPALPYLDVIYRMRNETNLPIAAYQVSGEYLMIKSASQVTNGKSWLTENDCIIESLTAIKRAGADFILTYFAKRAAEIILKS